MRKLISLIAICFISSTSFAAEWYPAFITYIDGNEQDVYIKFPLEATRGTVTITNNFGEEEKLQAHLLSSIEVTKEDETTYLFKRIYLLKYDLEVENEAVVGNIGWAFQVKSNDKMDYYAVGSEYKFSKKKNQLAVVAGGGANQVIHAFMRPEEEGATAVHAASFEGKLIGEKTYYKKCLAAYLGDNSDLAEKIMNDEYKKQSLELVFDAYCQ